MNELNRKLENIIQQEVDRKGVAGANILVLKNGEEAAYAQAGYADLEEGKLFKRDTITRLYSMSKPITGAAVMLLMERGMIDLCDPVEEYIPEFKNVKVDKKGVTTPANRPIRIQDLLHMTSGLCYGADCGGLSYTETEALFQEMIAKMDTDQAIGTVETARRLAGCPLSFHPGAHFQYGTSADVLGAVIEVVSGKRFGRFLAEEFFEPLGMKDTGFYVPEEKQDRLAKVYDCQNGDITLFTVPHLAISNDMKQPPAYEAGGAGLVSTLDDYAKFAKMLMQGGRYEDRQILKPGTVQYFINSGLLPWQQEDMTRGWTDLGGYTYGNLMRVMQHPELSGFRVTMGEYGWDGWLGAYFCNSPKDGITMLITQQKKDAGTTSLTRKLKNVVWNALAETE